MVSFPHCKINLGLHILGKRADGFHNIETVFYPVPWRDILEIIPSKNGMQFSCTGISIPDDPATNLCVKAYQLLKKDFASLPDCKIHLHKNIPIGAGLGGGSSDASAVLKLLNAQYKLQLSITELEKYAAQLGSDCAFFLRDGAMLATGRGELLSAIDLSLNAYHILLVNPQIHINTSWAFSQLRPEKTRRKSLTEMIRQPIDIWQGSLVNDFEIPILDAHPQIAAVKKQLIDSGAIYAAMSGSGSTVFGIFNKKISINLPFPPSYILQWV